EYPALFSARDFDAIRDMLADDVKLELINRRRLNGKEAADHFGNYARVDDWAATPGLIDDRPFMLVREGDDDTSALPNYFMMLERSGGKSASIRDFRSRNAIERAAVVPLLS